MSFIAFRINGEPKGKGRPRFSRMGNFVKTYTPEDTVMYENWVKICFQKAVSECNATIHGVFPIAANVPVKVLIHCVWDYPKSMSAKKRAVTEYVTKKPDFDNIAKCICDSLNGLAFHDDSQVARCEITKLYSTSGGPYTEVMITTDFKARL